MGRDIEVGRQQVGKIAYPEWLLLRAAQVGLVSGPYASLDDRIMSDLEVRSCSLSKFFYTTVFYTVPD